MPVPGRLPPHDELAERRLLAGLMRCPELVCPACLDAGASGESLYFHSHQIVWAAAWDLVGRGCDTGPADVFDAVRAAGLLGELGGANGWAGRPALWLAELWDEDPTGAWCYDSLIRVEDCRVRRDLIHRANEVLRDAYDRVREPEFYRRQLASLAR